MVRVPLLPATTTLVVAESFSSAALMTSVPTVRLVNPSGASMVKLPVTVAFSATLRSEAPTPAPSFGIETVGTPSLAPVTVKVTVVVEKLPSLSLRV